MISSSPRRNLLSKRASAMVVLARRWPFDFRRFDGVIIRRRIVFSSISRSHSLCSVWERELTPQAAVSFRRLPGSAPAELPHPGRSIPPPARAAALKTGRLSYRAACSNASRPRLDRREHDGTLIGAGQSRGSFQQRPSDDMTAAPSNTVIGLSPSLRRPACNRYNRRQ